MRKLFAPCSRQITMPTTYQSIFCRLDALPDAQPTVCQGNEGKKYKTQQQCLINVKFGRFKNQKALQGI